MRFLKNLHIIGAAFTIVGSLLPWEYAGGCFGVSIYYGVRIYLASFKYWLRGIHTFPVSDYGGVLVIILTLAILFLAWRPPRFVGNPDLSNLILSVALVVSSLYYLGRVVSHKYEARDIFGQTTGIMIGLHFVMLGSVLFLLRAVIFYRQNILHKNKNAG